MSNNKECSRLIERTLYSRHYLNLMLDSNVDIDFNIDRDCEDNLLYEIYIENPEIRIDLQFKDFKQLEDFIEKIRNIEEGMEKLRVNILNEEGVIR